MSFINNSLGFFRSTTVPLEKITAGVASIDTNHAQIHAANAFSMSGAITVAAGAKGAIQIDVPAYAYVHFQAAGVSASAGPAMLEFIEDASLSVAGAAIVPVNHHRLRNAESALTLAESAAATKVDGPAVKILATIPLHGFSQGGSTRISAQTAQPEEWIFKQSTSYLILLSNMDTSSVVFGYNLFWYEEESA